MFRDAGNVAPLRAPIRYLADRTPLEKMVRDIGATLGLSVHIAPGVAGTISGEFNLASAEALLDQLGTAQGFSWLIAESGLYLFVPEQQVTREIANPYFRLEQARQALLSLGKANAYINLQEPQARRLQLTAPPVLLELAVGVLQKANPAQTAVSGRALPDADEEFGFFALQHANVQDRTVIRRTERLVVPGVGAMVRRLVGSRLPAAAGETAPLAVAPVAIVEDTRLNALIIRAPKAMMPLFQTLIKQLDVAVPLIQLEAMIVDIDASSTNALGIDWSLKAGASSVGFNPPGAATGSGAAGLSLSTILGSRIEFLAHIRALEEQGKAEVLSQPSILTLNNATAVLDMSETFYIKNTGDHAVETVPVTTGLLLHVTPRAITPADGATQSFVTMQIEIEDGKTVAREVAGIPVVKNSMISTQATVADQQSLLLAGHQSKEIIIDQVNVPGLSALPLVGALFRHTSQHQTNRKRYFLITPRIVDISAVPEAQWAEDAAQAVSRFDAGP